MKGYNNMTGGLFDNEPLKIVNDPDRDVRAQQVAESLNSIHSGKCAMVDDVWRGIYQKLGNEGIPSDDWKRRTMEQVDLLAAIVPDPMAGQHVSPKKADSLWMNDLRNLAKRMMK